jgi:hypothetical protein
MADESGDPVYGGVIFSGEGPMAATTRSDGEPDQPGVAEGGDPVCWLHQLCPDCGAMPENSEICWRCGRKLDGSE